jgi:parallel beta-helix repeat protein/predicted outer membrane repeat protein
MKKIRRGLKVILAGFLAIFITSVTQAAIISVPADYPTIQEAIDAAVAGDTVQVSDGTYSGSGNVDLDFNGKAITVTSENGPAACIIDCQSVDKVSGFYFHSGEGPDSVVNGFKITNANGITNFCGGIYCSDDSNPTIEDNIITGCSGLAAGILSQNSSPAIVANTVNYNIGNGIYCQGLLGGVASPQITGNVITGNFGAGIWCLGNASPLIDSNTISFNAMLLGAGIYCQAASPTISSNDINGNVYGGIVCKLQSEAVITGNTVANNQESGIYCDNSPLVTIENNTISDNSAEFGGGIRCDFSSPSITGNTISGNSADKGGGICCGEDSSPTILNNIIADNSASSGGGICCLDVAEKSVASLIGNNIIKGNLVEYLGGGIYCEYASPIIVNNTIIQNEAELYGGGIYAKDSSAPTVTNTLFWIDFPDEIALDSSSAITVTYSDVYGGYAGAGNIDEDPCFSGPGDYHLMDESLCIGAGIVTADMPVTDIEGNPRPNPADSFPDMGAYENELSEPLLIPDISVDPESWSYGDVLIEEYSDNTFSVSNPGSDTLEVTATDLTGTNADEFSIESGGGSFSLDPGESHNIIVRFAPQSAGDKSAALSLANNVEGKNPLDVPLEGFGAESICPVEAISSDSGVIKALRQFRDNVLANNPTGRELVSTYYHISPEVAEILIRHPLLSVRSAVVLNDIMPGIRFLQGDKNGKNIRLTSALISSIDKLFAGISENGGQELSATLSMLKDRLMEFQGMRISEAWQAIK